MELTKTQIKAAGITYTELASACGVSSAAIAQQPANEPLGEKYQYLLLRGSKEAQSIRRKTLRHLKKLEDEK